MAEGESALVSFERHEKYLLIKGHGLRDSIQSMMEASKATYSQITKTQSHLLLVDYREVKITLPLSEAFNLIRNYENSMPFLKNTSAAVVLSESGLAFGRYWHEVGLQRGFNIALFENMEEAKNWLLSMDESR
jgi:hypothetical protein